MSNIVLDSSCVIKVRSLSVVCKANDVEWELEKVFYFALSNLAYIDF